jgi:hypothetical protein
MPNNINLYQPRAPRRAPVRRWLLPAALLAAGAIALSYALQARETAALQARLARAQANAERLARQAEQVPAAIERETKQLAALEQDVLALESLAARLTPGSVAAGAGFASQLRAFGRATAEGVWLTGIRIDQTSGQLTLEGRALDAARLPLLIAALGGEPAFNGLAFATLDLKLAEDAGRGDMPADVVKFRVASTPKDTTPIAAATVAGAAASGMGAGR